MAKIMKISYLISSIHGEASVKTVVEDIYNLPSHDFEIIVCSPFEVKDSRVKWVKDDKANGSVYGYNKSYLASSGDCIVACVDDHHLPNNFLETIDFLESEVVKKLKLKIANLTFGMGGPGKIYYVKNDATKQPAKNILWPLEQIFPPNFPNRRPFNVFHFPVLMRESIEKYMGNVIFNESFNHHYPDSWLGFYEELINGERPSEELGPKNVFFKEIRSINIQRPNTSFDKKDKAKFLKLVEISNHKDLQYNIKI